MTANSKFAKSVNRLQRKHVELVRKGADWRGILDLFYKSLWFQERLRFSAGHLIRKYHFPIFLENDLKQEALLVFARSLQRNRLLGFDELKGTYGTYVSMIIFRCCQKALRQFRYIETQKIAGESDHPYEEIVNQLDELIDLRDRVDHVSQPYRSVVRMICCGMSIDEIAKVKKCSRRTVYRWVERSIRMLRQAMN